MQTISVQSRSKLWIISLDLKVNQTALPKATYKKIDKDSIR